MNKFTHLFLALLFALSMTSCDKPIDHVGPPTSVDPSKYFDFHTVYGCPIEIDCDIHTLISVYDCDPEQNPEAKPIYATYTDASGHYSGKMQIPTAYEGKQLWAKGFGIDATATVDRKGVKFSARYSDPRARGEGSELDHKFTDEELRLECQRLYELYLQRLPESHNNKSKLTETENLAIHTLKDDTEIFFSFVNSGGRYVSQLYYFYFPEEVDAKDYMIDYVTKKAEEQGKTPDLSSLNLRTEFMRIFTNDNSDPTKQKFLLTRDWGVFYTGKAQYISNKAKKSENAEKLVVCDPKGNVLTGNGFLNAPVSFSQAEMDAVKANNIIQQKNAETTYSWPAWDYLGYGYINRNFNNNIGAHHHLRFYGRNYDEYLDEPNYNFPARYRIGFILKVLNTDMDVTNKQKALNCFTTNNALNLDGAVQCARNLAVSPSDVEHDITNIVYGYEDQRLDKIGTSTTEPDYNDFMFLISASPAVSTVGLERMVNQGEMYIDGTLLYEDLYPDAGDYDMNDVMVEYEMWVKFDENNYVTSIESKFWPINYGATYTDDFYMELRTDDNKGHFHQFIEPELTLSASQLRTMSDANIQDIMAGRRPQRSVTHHHTFKPEDKLHRDSVTIENFNPFIYCQNTNREVHLTNGRFCGVNGASLDGLTPDQKKYYPLMIHDGSMLDGCYFPYAMNVPRRFSSSSQEGFMPVTESVYIVLEYMRFLDWMREPNNPAYKDWYNYYQKWGGK